ncbi:pterocarpan synthase 1-like [Rutidosis leptorrhynchoides]|uniref:pterocarpan synthase 1-like n=1 Tax=Rutidosis leptorrhynchoides TaxID=125765 RepID=UPI003A99D550
MATVFVVLTITLVFVSSSINLVTCHFCEISVPQGMHNIKLTQMTIYRQDSRAGIIQVAGPPTPANDNLAFGTTLVGDFLMTVAPDPRSKEIGRLQGMAVGVSRSDPNNTSLSSSRTHISFTHGKYRGSTLSILGISNLSEPVRESPVVGGTGELKLSSGYAELRDVSDYPDVEEYRICVLHYSPRA